MAGAYVHQKKTMLSRTTVPRTEKLENPKKFGISTSEQLKLLNLRLFFCWNRAAEMCFEKSQKFLHFFGGNLKFPFNTFWGVNGLYTLQEINISHLGKRKIIFKYALSGGYVNSLEGKFFGSFKIQKLPKVVGISGLSLGFLVVWLMIFLREFDPMG